MDVFAFPFRLDSSGRVAKVQQGGDADMAQKIANLMQIEKNTLPLAPHFGIDDPVFSSVHPGQIRAAVAVFYPEISIDGIRLTVTPSGTQAMQISFSSAS